MTTKQQARRRFLQAAAATVAAPCVIPASALGAAGRPSPSNRIVMGGIGIGNMGGGDLNAFLHRDDVQYVAACDVQKPHRDAAKARVDTHYGNADCAAYNDFRELLARPDVDAVHVATPDHWHGTIVVAACRNGKDVYCQKPESITIREGRAMVQAARLFGRVVSGGSQRVLGDTGAIARRCWNGEYGKLKEVFVNCGGPSKFCDLPGEAIPDGVDWEMWLGPAPWAPYHPYRISGTFSINGTGWRSWRDYSGGGMTDWGAHRFGGATFAAGVQDQQPVEVIPPDGKDVKLLTYRFANGLLMYHGGAKGAIEVVGTPNEPIAARPMPEYNGTGGIHGDFLHCMRSRQRPFRDIEIAHNTMVVCHLGLIAYQLNRALKWDPKTETIVNDESANRLTDRARREPWTV